jgi:hypothetical protein
MTYNRIIPILLLIVGLALSSCSAEDVGIFNRQRNRNDPNGFRFVLMQGQRQLQNGKFILSCSEWTQRPVKHPYLLPGIYPNGKSYKIV